MDLEFSSNTPPDPRCRPGLHLPVLAKLGVWWPQLWGCGDTYWSPLALHAQQVSPQAV